MATHQIKMYQPGKTVLHSDVTFEILSNKSKIGELRISRGTIDWCPPGHQKFRSISWERFAAIMNETYDN